MAVNIPEPLDGGPTQEELAYWVAFNRIPKIGPVRFAALVERFGTLATAWRATLHDFELLGMPQDAIQQLGHWRPRIDLSAEMDAVHEAGARVLTWLSPLYPARLREIDASPPVLYVRGEITEADHLALGVVGTRSPTTYGKDIAARICQDLADQGLTIVSGLALGIDGIAHRAALDAGGRTIAVLGCGVDVDYPARHRKLSEEIAQSGAVISEYGMGIKPVASNFPPRNRIISGLSLGTLVVEAGERSGALITLRFALEQGRDTFCVPGSVYSKMSKGTNGAISRSEAKLVTSAEDILTELDVARVAQQRETQLTLADAPINTDSDLLALIEHEPIHVDEIIRRSGKPVATVTSELAILELGGSIRQVAPMTYVLAH